MEKFLKEFFFCFRVAIPLGIASMSGASRETGHIKSYWVCMFIASIIQIIVLVKHNEVTENDMP